MSFLNNIIRYGTLLFVFLIPWQARLILSEGSINGGYWEYGTSSLYATELILFVVLLAIVLRGAKYIKTSRLKFSKKRFFSIEFAILLLIIWAGISIFWSSDLNVSLERFVVLIEACVVFMIVSSGKISVRKIMWAIIFSGFIQAIFGICQFFYQDIFSSTWLGISSQDPSDLGVSVVDTGFRRWLRAYGSFPHPNILAGWLVMSLSLLVYDLKRDSERVLDVLRYPFLMFLVFGLLATFSRSAWLGFFIFLIVFVIALFLRRAWLRGIKIVLVVGVTVAVFFTVFSEPMMTRLGMQSRLEQKSNQERASSLSEAWQIIKMSPVVGVGIGNYGLSVRDKIDSSQEAWYYQPVHNAPLLIFAELGVIGILIFVSCILFLLWKERRFNFFVLLIPIVIISLLDHYPWSLYSGMMMWAGYLGVLVGMRRECED